MRAAGFVLGNLRNRGCAGSTLSVAAGLNTIFPINVALNMTHDIATSIIRLEDNLS